MARMLQRAPYSRNSPEVKKAGRNKERKKVRKSQKKKNEQADLKEKGSSLAISLSLMSGIWFTGDSKPSSARSSCNGGKKRKEKKKRSQHLLPRKQPAFHMNDISRILPWACSGSCHKRHRLGFSYWTRSWAPQKPPQRCSASQSTTFHQQNPLVHTHTKGYHSVDNSQASVRSFNKETLKKEMAEEQLDARSSRIRLKAPMKKEKKRKTDCPLKTLQRKNPLPKKKI